MTAHAPHNKSVRSYSNVSAERLILWLAALEVRHLANLRVAEVTRALRALSSAYVQRRHKVASGSTLDSAGKRAAFALYYGPLHFIATAHVLQSLEATRRGTSWTSAAGQARWAQPGPCTLAGRR